MILRTSSARSAAVLVVLALSASGNAQQTSMPIRLSNDAGIDSIARRCLLRDSAVVAPRFRDEEVFAAVDPKNPNRMIAAWQTRSGRGGVIQSTRSTDGGMTWTPPRAVPINACAGGPVADTESASDPWVTFGPDGRAYVSAIAWKPGVGDQPDAVSALVVVSSSDGGATWNPPTAAAIAKVRTMHDNLAISTDLTRPGTIYATTTLEEYPAADTYHGRLGFTASVDGGRTWSPIRAITPPVNGERIGAPAIVSNSRTGRLHVVYRRSVRGHRVFATMTSDDAGKSWSPEIVISPHTQGSGVRHPQTGARFVLAQDIASVAMSPDGALMAVAFTNADSTGSGGYRVMLSWSADGHTWSGSRAVSESRVQTAWLPGVAIRGNGEIGVTYFGADFNAGPKSFPNATLYLQRFRVDRDTLTPTGTSTLYEGTLEWPGDYQALVAARNGFRAFFHYAGEIGTR